MSAIKGVDVVESTIHSQATYNTKHDAHESRHRIRRTRVCSFGVSTGAITHFLGALKLLNLVLCSFAHWHNTTDDYHQVNRLYEHSRLMSVDIFAGSVCVCVCVHGATVSWGRHLKARCSPCLDQTQTQSHWRYPFKGVQSIFGSLPPLPGRVAAQVATQDSGGESLVL